MSDIRIIVGSETGTALALAEELVQLLETKQYKAIVDSNPQKALIAEKPASEVLLICTATWGKGEIPINLQPFYHQLLSEPLSLACRRYGIICLGDSSFKSFANAGKTLDIALQQAGLSRTGEMLKIDGYLDSSPTNQAETWLNQWVSLL